MELVDADETDLALDHLVHVLAQIRVPLLREEYDRIMSAATMLGCPETVTEAGLDRLTDG
ncbi:hypothetical protein [Streptomyces sp. RFCAC02]|uniref:hypothetical protein n=1 Tax=Streptomyces sp. RFCAC02 TaxID=2499143 RepID=UPI0010208ACC|nr:hypothetical protein [Streptomyces sp. RFCAC02]